MPYFVSVPYGKRIRWPLVCLKCGQQMDTETKISGRTGKSMLPAFFGWKVEYDKLQMSIPACNKCDLWGEGSHKHIKISHVGNKWFDLKFRKKEYAFSFAHLNDLEVDWKLINVYFG